MDKRPKRKKFNDNPYILESDINNNKYYISFKNYKVEVNKDIFDIFDESEKYENAKIKEYAVHIEHSDIDINQINTVIKNLEQEVIDNIFNEELYSIINKLSNIQRNRIIKYFFEYKTLSEIAIEENCTKVAVKYSIDCGINNIKTLLNR